MPRFLFALALSLLVGTAATASSPDLAGTQVKVHTIAMKVIVDGNVVMTPNVRTLDGSTVKMTVGGTGANVGYAIEFNVEDRAKTRAGAIGLSGSLHRLQGERRELLAAPDLTYLAGTSPSMQIGPQGVHGVEIEIVSHAVSMEDASGISAKSCEASTAPINIPASSDCCSATCANGQIPTCCGAISCCG